MVYEGNFDKGEFHGEGTLIYPNGGRYVAKWNCGKLLGGEYFFYDNLQFKDKDWNYCTIQDRQFYTEQLKGLRPDGKTLICNDINGPKSIPEGCYDIGDGYYDPTKRIICKYDGEFKRNLELNEEQWITEKCLYKPRAFDDDSHMDGSEDKIIKEMIKLNNNPQLRAEREKQALLPKD